MESLKDLKQGEWGIVERINSGGDIYRRFLDIGLIDGTRVMCVTESPSGDPKAFLIRGAVIAIRLSDCATIAIRRL